MQVVVSIKQVNINNLFMYQSNSIQNILFLTNNYLISEDGFTDMFKINA